MESILKKRIPTTNTPPPSGKSMPSAERRKMFSDNLKFKDNLHCDVQPSFTCETAHSKGVKTVLKSDVDSDHNYKVLQSCDIATNSVIRKNDGAHSNNVPLVKVQGVVVHSNDDKSHSEEDGIHSNDDKSHSEEDGIHSNDDKSHSNYDKSHLEEDGIDSNDDKSHSEEHGIHSNDDKSHSNDDKSHLEKDGIHSNDDKSHSNDDKSHSEEHGIHSNDDKSHSEEDGIHSNDDKSHSNYDKSHLEEDGIDSNDDKSHSEENGIHSNDDKSHSNDDKSHSEEDGISSNDDKSHSNDSEEDGIHSNDDKSHSDDDKSHSDDDKSHSDDDKSHSEEDADQSDDVTLKLQSIKTQKIEDELRSKDITTNTSLSQYHDITSENHNVIAASCEKEMQDQIKMSASRKYTENLLKDIDVAFKMQNREEQVTKASTNSARGRVATAVAAYEVKLEKIYTEAKSDRSSTYTQALEEWRNVARSSSMGLGLAPAQFQGRNWIEPKVKSNEEVKKEDLNEGTKKKLHKIASELLSTEETYVEILFTLDQIYYKRFLEASEKGAIPESVAKQIFQHLSAIYVFHSTYLLPQLQDRLAKWDEAPRIGDIMMQAGPFLKMYTLYIDNYYKAIKNIETMKDKSKEFVKLVEATRRSPECKDGDLQAHMLTPVQRTPRYEMLLKSYLEKLPNDSAQRNEVEIALDLVSVAAAHSNDYLRTKEKTIQVSKIYEKLVSISFDTHDCSRELVKEGKVIKLAARDGKEQPRYLYLFNDCLLYCKDCPSVHKVQGKIHSVIETLTLDGMVASANDTDGPPVFYINGVERQLDLLSSSVQERDDWVTFINEAVGRRIESQESFLRVKNKTNEPEEAAMSRSSLISPQTLMPSGHTTQVEETRKSWGPRTLQREQLGLRAPEWVKDYDVTMCMKCSERFHSIMRRRHHCRACGQVVCSSCSKKKVTLVYQPKSPQRVCDTCYFQLNRVDTFDPGQNVNEVKDHSREKSNLFSSFLHVKYKERWEELWCIIPSSSPQTCMCYQAKKDLKPLLLLSFTQAKIQPVDTQRFPHCFMLSDVLGEKYTFASDNKEIFETLKKLINHITSKKLVISTKTIVL